GVNPRSDTALSDASRDGRPAGEGARGLEERLRGAAEARRRFALSARLHTDLHLDVRARRAGERALERLGQPTAPRVGAWRRLVRPGAIVAAGLLLAAALGSWLL